MRGDRQDERIRIRMRPKKFINHKYGLIISIIANNFLVSSQQKKVIMIFFFQKSISRKNLHK